VRCIKLKKPELKYTLSIFLTLMATVFCGSVVLAQEGSLEFVENRGQWDSAVQFRAAMSNTTFFLQKHGFSVLMENPADMDALRKAIHGITSGETVPGKSAVVAPLVFQKPAVSVPGGNTSEKNGNNNTPTPGANSSTGVLAIHSHIYQVEFLNSSDGVLLQGDKPLDTYNNYFIGNDSAKWKSNCKIYQAVVYKNIYPGIDLRYYTENNGLKYDLVVHPGGNPDNIVLKYKGADKLMVKSGQITIHTSVGDVIETIPQSYQLSKDGKKDVECSYISGKDHTIRFHVTNYNPGATLIIDPTLVFSSFTGSHSDNWGYTATYDQSGNFYSGSITLNSVGGNGNGFPVSAGAFQSTFKGGDMYDDGGWQYDITILKFSSNGVNRMYATYLGGSGNEQPHSLVTDAVGNLVIAGRTSSPNFPNVNSTGLKDILHGGYDIILAKLNTAGTNLIGSRIIGGSSNDGVNIAPKYSTSPIPMGQRSLRLNYGDDGRSEVILDDAGNVYLASCTASADFPVTANAFQKTIGGQQDGVFIKTSPDLSNILASTYLGGSSDDAAFALALNPKTNNVYIGGGTSSNNFPGTANGTVVQNKNSGGIDGFLSIVSNDGGTLIKTSYFGTTGTEVIYGVQFDKNGYPYIMGTTTGAWPVINATFSQPKGKQFISKLQPDISAYVYSTVFGKGSNFPDISPTAFLVDRCENVYVAGWGGGIETEGTASGVAAVYSNSNTSGLTTTPGAFKAVSDGNDFYFFVMKKDAVSQLFGSFYGQTGGKVGDHVDGGTSRFDKQGIIYEAICANCYGGDFPTTPNVWAPKNGTGSNGCNLAAVKIAFNFAGVAADPKSFINGRYDSSGCVPLDVVFKDTLHNAKLYRWNFGDGSADTTTVAFQVTHTFMNVGNYTVRLIAIDSTTCNIADTAYLHIRVRTDRAILDFDIAKQPPCESLSYIFTNVSTPPGGKAFKPGDFSWNFGDGTTSPYTSPIFHSYAASGTYLVQLILADTSYCNSPDTAIKTLRVSPFVKAQFDVPDGCAPYDAVFNNTTLAGQNFVWNFGDGTMPSTEMDPTHNYPDTGTYTVSLLAVDSNTCNIRDSITKTVRVNPKPTADFNIQPVPSQYNTPTVFFNLSMNATHYEWLFGDGDLTIKNSMDTVIHQFQQTNTFNVCLIAINQFDCADTMCHPVESLINPLLDVPNAFTPGRFGQNSIIMVKGFGIAAMDWKIYNRWGQVVFESNNPFNGWDGTYKGAIQPMDVYAYTLDATFFDGTKTRRTGDITLIR
jgi:gliding motility-associated-like protein